MKKSLQSVFGIDIILHDQIHCSVFNALVVFLTSLSLSLSLASFVLLFSFSSVIFERGDFRKKECKVFIVKFMSHSASWVYLLKPLFCLR